MDNGWSDRDSLPTGDPIGDVVEDKFKKDQEVYLQMMKNRVISTANKNFSVSYEPIKYINITIEIPKEKKCDCGVAKTYKNPTLRMHSDWCELLRK